MKTILVTGGAGYIGSHTVVDLLENNYDVVIIDNFSNSKPKVLENIKKITNKEFKFYEGNVQDKELIEKIFTENKIDGVIHFAALKAVGESVEKPLEYYHNNLFSTITLLEVMKKYNSKNFVFSSSATVYGVPKTLPLKEDAPLSVSNPYGATKLMIEDILKDLYASDNSWNIVILRYFNPVGCHSSHLIGEDPNGIPNNLMPYINQVACGKLDYLRVFGNDYDTIDGTGVRDYIHVVDLAQGHLKALDKARKFTGVETYNLGTGTGYSVLQIVKAFEDATGVEVKYKIVDRRPGDIATCYADPSKAKNDLGWEAKKGIEEMCKDSWRFTSNN